MAYKSETFIKFLDKVKDLPTIYMWGTFGKKVTEEIIRDKKKQYPTRYSNSRVNLLYKHIGKSYGCDCCGLIKWFLMTDGGKLATPKYSSKYDKNASGFYNAATEKGKISTIPEIPGIAVYKKGHIGVYIGKGKVCECTLSKRGDGVVVTNLKDEKWTHWLKIPFIVYPEVLDVDKIAKEVVKGKYGVNPERKKKLTSLYGADVAKAIQDRVNELYYKRK